MCGIAGFCRPGYDYGTEPEKWNQILENMNRIQKHRGPDGAGIRLVKGCGMAHVRRSVIDLKTGQQPMTRTAGGHTCSIVYNGEIYNVHELKQELTGEGVSFETASDTEIILAGYMIYGLDFVHKLNGVFSMVIWDESRSKGYALRDRLGVKPLFYRKMADTFVFSSEIKGLFQYPGITPVIHHDGLCEIFGLGPAKTCGKGVFKDIQEVLPGHYIELTADGIKEREYWKLESKPHEDSYAQTVEKTTALLYDAVKKQMRSDVPISTLLSGGVDSSLVTAICAKELKKEGKTLDTFSFDFVDNQIHFKANRFQPSQDRPWVDRMAAYSETNHQYLECDNQELIDYLFEAVDARDLPCMADVESSMLYFCSKVTDFNKVTLTGEGADEIFGGYPWFHKKEMFETNAFPWSMDNERRKVLLKDDLLDQLSLDAYVQNAYESTINETPILIGEEGQEKRRRELAYLNMKWFMVTLLDRMDRTSMHSGLEARVPFADYRIVEYIWNVPWNMKCPNGLVKGLLRAAGEEFLPKDVLYRKKSPYPKTYHPEYEKILGDRLLEVITDTRAPIRSFIDHKKVELFLSSPSDYGKPWYGQLMAGPQMLAFMLQVNYWLEHYKIEVVL